MSSEYKRQSFWRQEAQNQIKRNARQPAIHIHLRHPSAKLWHSLPARQVSTTRSSQLYVPSQQRPTYSPQAEPAALEEFTQSAFPLLSLRNSGSHLKPYWFVGQQSCWMQNGRGTREDDTSCSKWKAEASKYPSCTHSACQQSPLSRLPSAGYRGVRGTLHNIFKMIIGHQLKMQLTPQKVFQAVTS